jgi:hypothetical protein
MRPAVQAFRDAAIQVCRARNFPFSRFMESHALEELLQEAESGAWPPKQIAGQALFRCCVTDGTFNNFQVGLLSVMTFLNEHLGTLGQGEFQAFKDLVNILKGRATVGAITQWLDTHYK